MARRKVNRPTKKKLLTIDDLYSFYLEQNKTCKFSSEESGYQLSVQVPAYFEVSDEEDDTLLFCTVKLMHSGENRNHSNVTDEALTKAAKGLAYKPILAMCKMPVLLFSRRPYALTSTLLIIAFDGIDEKSKE